MIAYASSSSLSNDVLKWTHIQGIVYVTLVDPFASGSNEIIFFKTLEISIKSLQKLERHNFSKKNNCEKNIIGSCGFQWH
jgi:phosphate/sulfate permease